MMKYLIWFGILIFVWSVLACKEQDPPLTRSEKKWIDTLYQNEVKLIKKKIDSVCIAQNDSIYTQNFDSILQKRKDERALIIQRIKTDKDE